MKNKTNNVPWPFYFLDTFLKYELEGLINTYERKKVEAFFNQCRFMKKRSQQNRYKMNLSFLECSEYKHKIKQVRNWIKEFDSERDLRKENERLKVQIEKMKRCTNCKHNECKCEDVVCKKENECWYDKAEEEHLFLELEKVKLECWELAE